MILNNSRISRILNKADAMAWGGVTQGDVDRSMGMEGRTIGNVADNWGRPKENGEPKEDQQAYLKSIVDKLIEKDVRPEEYSAIEEFNGLPEGSLGTFIANQDAYGDAGTTMDQYNGYTYNPSTRQYEINDKTEDTPGMQAAKSLGKEAVNFVANFVLNSLGPVGDIGKSVHKTWNTYKDAKLDEVVKGLKEQGFTDGDGYTLRDLADAGFEEVKTKVDTDTKDMTPEEKQTFVKNIDTDTYFHNGNNRVFNDNASNSWGNTLLGNGSNADTLLPNADGIVNTVDGVPGGEGIQNLGGTDATTDLTKSGDTPIYKDFVNNWINDAHDAYTNEATGINDAIGLANSNIQNYMDGLTGDIDTFKNTTNAATDEQSQRLTGYRDEINSNNSLTPFKFSLGGQEQSFIPGYARAAQKQAAGYDTENYGNKTTGAKDIFNAQEKSFTDLNESERQKLVNSVMGASTGDGTLKWLDNYKNLVNLESSKQANDRNYDLGLAGSDQNQQQITNQNDNAQPGVLDYIKAISSFGSSNNDDDIDFFG